VRAVALDVHRDFCEVAIVEEGRVRSAGRIRTRPEALELFAQSLDPRDWVALEVTGNAWAIARILEAHVTRVIVVSPSDICISRRVSCRISVPLTCVAQNSSSGRGAVKSWRKLSSIRGRRRPRSLGCATPYPGSLGERAADSLPGVTGEPGTVPRSAPDRAVRAQREDFQAGLA
jgi:hypothetical protein